MHEPLSSANKWIQHILATILLDTASLEYIELAILLLCMFMQL